MAISGYLQDNEKKKFVESDSVPGQPAVVVTNADGSNVGTGPSGLATASVTSVNDSASSVTLLSSSTTARERIIQNDSSSILYVKFGTTASTTSYTAKLATDDILTTQYTGRIDGIWSADSTGAVRITELS